MKKRYITLLFCSVLLGNAFTSNSFWCDYKDYFHISSASHPGIFISSATFDDDLYMQVISPRSFILRDTPRCISGYAHVTLMLDINSWCVLDIKDGPWVNTPQIHASCHGLEYQGLTYDGMGTHSYTIRIS
ncbi:MAG: hypothetical protein JJT82_07270 [Legionellaceae bacterium]|nr:hypothetical protein [Legionellaceae bacterium]